MPQERQAAQAAPAAGNVPYQPGYPHQSQSLYQQPAHATHIPQYTPPIQPWNQYAQPGSYSTPPVHSWDRNAVQNPQQHVSSPEPWNQWAAHPPTASAHQPVNQHWSHPAQPPDVQHAAGYARENRSNAPFSTSNFTTPQPNMAQSSKVVHSMAHPGTMHPSGVLGTSQSYGMQSSSTAPGPLPNLAALVHHNLGHANSLDVTPKPKKQKRKPEMDGVGTKRQRTEVIPTHPTKLPARTISHEPPSSQTDAGAKNWTSAIKPLPSTRWYGIKGGGRPGVFTDYAEVSESIKNHGGKQKRFPSREKAQAWVDSVELKPPTVGVYATPVYDPVVYDGKKATSNSDLLSAPGQYASRSVDARNIGLPANLLGTQRNPFELESSPEPTVAQTKGVKWYGVQVGHKPGVYTDWEEVQAQISGVRGAKQKKFPTRAQALAFVDEGKTISMAANKLVPPGHAFSTASEVAPDDGPPLCKEQADLVDLIMRGHNVFYTGSAGCGKSTVLKAFVKRFAATGKKVNILAPTGRAALAVNGTTTWSYVGWVPSHHKKTLAELLEGANGKLVWKRLNETQVLVIDEISMVENLHLERINLFMQKARGNGRPFGGVQVIVTGDFCQLPPVKPFQHCLKCGIDLMKDERLKEYRCKQHGTYYDKDKWAFRSDAWKACAFVYVELTDIHRQSDKVFIGILQSLRVGRPLSTKDVDLLLNHETPGFNANAVKLFGSRAEVARVNLERFNKLRTKPHSYMCLDDFRWNEKHFNLKNKGQVDENGVLVELDRNEHRYSSRVDLKKGMAVVLLANLDIGAGLVNGSQGIIQSFEKFDRKKMPTAASKEGRNNGAAAAASQLTGEAGKKRRQLVGDYATYREDQIDEFMKRSEVKELPVVQFLNGQSVTIYPDCTINEYGDSKPWTLLARTQIPLTAGYAITTHKSQGMTLDKVEVDLSRTFEPGQAYVALSRARSLQGLKVASFPEAARRSADPQVQEFLREHFPDSLNTPNT